MSAPEPALAESSCSAARGAGAGNPRLDLSPRANLTGSWRAAEAWLGAGGESEVRGGLCAASSSGGMLRGAASCSRGHQA